MGTLFDEIEKRFSTKVSFLPEGDGWLYRYALVDPFLPLPAQQQEILFRAEGEKAGAAESVSSLTAEFRLSSENCLDFLDTLDNVVQKLGGDVAHMHYFLYRQWPENGLPAWLEEPRQAFPYMVWGSHADACDQADLGELKTHLVAERRNWWRSCMGDGAESPGEGIFCSGEVRVAFSLPGRDWLLPYIPAGKGKRKKQAQLPTRQTIIVVDDNVLTLELLEVLLRSSFTEEELEIITCEQGPAVFELALEHRPGLILLDIMMPEKNGLEVLEELKADERTRDIHVVMLSVLSSDETVRRARELGAVKYLTKPFVPYDINEVIRELLLPDWAPME